MKQRHFQIELVNSPCCYNSVVAAKPLQYVLVKIAFATVDNHVSNSSSSEMPTESNVYSDLEAASCVARPASL
jgi:hypothetical protein